MHVVRGIRVKTDEVGASIGKGTGQCVHRLHHQMHINRHGDSGGGDGMWFECATNHRAEGEVGHVMVVHHVKMNPVAASGNDIFQLFTQSGKVSGKERGCNSIVHALSLAN